MKTVIQEHAFDDPRFKNAAKYMKKNKIYIEDVMHLYTVHHAAVRMWRHSQQHGVVNATGAEIDEWTDIELVHRAFAEGRLITLVRPGEDSLTSVYRIHGNEDSIKKLYSIKETRSEIGKRGAEARWRKEKQLSDKNRENGKRGAKSRWENATSNGETQNNAEINGEMMAIAIQKMAIAIDSMAIAKEPMAIANEKMANDGKQRKRVSKKGICNSYLPNSEFPNSDPVSDAPNNLLKNDPHNNAAVTLPNSVSNDLAIVPSVKLTAKTRKPARDRAVVVTKEMNQFWEEYAAAMKKNHDVNTKPNRSTFPLIQRIFDSLGDETIATLRVFLQQKHPAFWIPKHSLGCFERHMMALNVHTQQIIAWEEGRGEHPDDIDALARKLYANKQRNGRV